MVTRGLLPEEEEDSLSSLLLMIAISRSSWLIMAMWSVIDSSSLEILLIIRSI